MIDKMEIRDWELRENDYGDFKVILYLKPTHNQFGGRKDHERLFHDIIKRKNAYYSTGIGGYISTNYASSKQTLESIKGILQSIDHLNQWIDDENYMREIDKDILHKKLTQKLYPVPEKEGE